MVEELLKKRIKHVGKLMLFFVKIQSKPNIFTVTEMMGKMQAKLGEAPDSQINYFKANEAKQALM